MAGIGEPSGHQPRQGDGAPHDPRFSPDATAGLCEPVTRKPAPCAELSVPLIPASGSPPSRRIDASSGNREGVAIARSSAVTVSARKRAWADRPLPSVITTPAVAQFNSRSTATAAADPLDQLAGSPWLAR